MEVSDLHNLFLTFHLTDGRLGQLRNFSQAEVAAIATIESQVAPHPWREQQFLDSTQCRHICVGVWVEEALAGYAVFSLAAGEAELLILGTARDWQKQGIAFGILASMETVLEQHAQEIFLEVRESNLAAISLYEKIGFNCLGQRKNYYPALPGAKSKREDALIYGKHISGTL